MSDHVKFGIVMVITLLHGLVYTIITPPWQHYDEPGHFERVALAAQNAFLAQEEQIQPELRRHIAASMAEHHFYTLLGSAPVNLLLDQTKIDIGYDQLNDPPLYYALASLPLRLAPSLDITSQLRLARLVSLLLFLLTIGLVAGMMRELTPPAHPLRWAVPLCVALLPPFADLMTGVNNDVGAVVALSAFCWGAARTIVSGITGRRVLWLVTTALLGVATKVTAAIALPLLPLVLLCAWWRQRGWRWRWLYGTLAALTLLALAVGLRRVDAAYWYLAGKRVGNTPYTRVARQDAPLGSSVLSVTSTATGARRLFSALPAAEVPLLADQEVTVGAWLWANRPVRITAPQLNVFDHNLDRPFTFASDEPIDLDVTPRFFAWSTRLVGQPQRINYTLVVPPTEEATPGGKGRGVVYMDGAVVARGAFSAATPPRFDTPEAQSGTWDGRPFANLVRNGSAERAWFHSTPALDNLIVRYTYTTPSLLLESLQDVDRTGKTVFREVPAALLFDFFGAFGWSDLRLSKTLSVVFLLVPLIAGAGVVALLARRRRALPPGVGTALVVLGLGCATLWSITIMRVLPMLSNQTYTPTPRYTFPMIGVTMLALVGGWWSLWPSRYRAYALGLLLAALLALDSYALATVIGYYRDAGML